MGLSRRSIWFLFGGCFGAAIILSLLLGSLGLHPWAGISAERVSGYHHEQCETVRATGFFLQFHNLWSNVAYFVVGLMILSATDVWPGRIVGSVLIMLAIFSGWFHATLSEFGQTVDIISVYATLLALLAYGFIEMVPLRYDDAKSYIIMVGAIVFGMIGGYFRTNIRFFDSDYFTPFLVFILIVYMVVGGLRARDGAEQHVPASNGLLLPMFIAIIAALIAVVFKFSDGDDNAFLARHSGDLSKCVYGPDSIVQGHAAWHVFSAIMFWGLFEFFRSLLARSNSSFPWRAVSR